MVDKIIGLLVTVLALTALAVVVSRRAQTANVLTAFFKGFAGLQNAATAPVTK